MNKFSQTHRCLNRETNLRRTVVVVTRCDFSPLANMLQKCVSLPLLILTFLLSIHAIRFRKNNNCTVAHGCLECKKMKCPAHHRMRKFDIQPTFSGVNMVWIPDQNTYSYLIRMIRMRQFNLWCCWSYFKQFSNCFGKIESWTNFDLNRWLSKIFHLLVKRVDWPIIQNSRTNSC